jgi:hypothetical protein
LETAIYVVWIITLLLALALTVIVLPIIGRILVAAREIDLQLKRALEGAGGIAANTAPVGDLAAVLDKAGALAGGVAAIERVSAGIHEKVAAVGSILLGRGKGRG